MFTTSVDGDQAAFVDTHSQVTSGRRRTTWCYHSSPHRPARERANEHDTGAGARPLLYTQLTAREPMPYIGRWHRATSGRVLVGSEFANPFQGC